MVAEGNRLQESFQFVVAVRPLSQDVEEKVDLAA
jgi:hypothetical protein